MQVFLDHDPLTTEATTLGGIIDDALNKIGESDRLIVEIRLDGETLATDRIETLVDQQVTADEVQLVTADKHLLAEQTLLDVGEALKAANEDQKQAATLLQEDRPAEAMDHVRRALGVWQQAERSITQTSQLLEIDLAGVKVAEQQAEQLIEALAEQLTAVVEQMKSQDWIGLADSLAYDLTETAERWIGLVEELSGRARAGRGDG